MLIFISLLKVLVKSPLGPFTEILLFLPILISTFSGIFISCIPILDIIFLHYHITQMTSPPKRSCHACLCVIIPLEVETIVIPKSP